MVISADKGKVRGSRYLAVEHCDTVAALFDAARLLCSGGTGVGADCHMEGIVTAALEAEVHIV